MRMNIMGIWLVSWLVNRLVGFQLVGFLVVIFFHLRKAALLEGGGG